MIDKISNKYGLTREGSVNFIRSSFIEFINCIVSSLPIVIFIYLINEVMIRGKPVTVSFMITLALVALIAMFFSNYVNYSNLYISAYRESERVRNNLVNTLRKLPLSFFAKKEDTYISNLLVNDVTEQERLFSHAMPKIFGGLPFIILSIGGLLIVNPSLTLVTFSVIPISIIIFLLSNKMERKAHEKYSTVLKDQSDFFQEIIERIPEIKYYNHVEKSEQELFAILDKQEKEHLNSELPTATFQGLINALLKASVALVISYGGILLYKNEITIFTFLIFILAANKLTLLMSTIFEFYSMRRYADNRIQQIREVKSFSEQTSQNHIKPDITSYSLKVENLSFSYKNRNHVLDNISLDIKERKVTAVVGPSGSGKSTLFKLLSGLLPYQAGEILLDQVPISQIDNEYLYDKVSMVFQDVTLFNTTIFENIKMGNRNASDSEVLAAARLAQCDEFCEKFKDGYHTVIGENGKSLSGGQRQRISIARAILKDSPILLLDELTSGLDFKNEFLVQKAINKLIQNKTVVVIAHRLKTIENADNIVVLEKGRIVDQGTKETLLQRCTLFKEMWKNNENNEKKEDIHEK